MEYATANIDDTERIDLSEQPAIPTDLTMSTIGSALGTSEMELKVWYFEPGEEIDYHAHAEQEEVFYVIQGEFSVKIGRSGETEYIQVGPGDFWAAAPMIGHGHRNVGNDQGVLLAIGAGGGLREPGGLDPHALDDADIDAAVDAD